MTAARVIGEVMVPFFAVLMCLAPAMTRPTVAFGVRVPAERAGSPVIRQERRAYLWRTAVVGACCTIAAVLLAGYGSWWLSRIILFVELAADFGCYALARRKITAVKSAQAWYAGHRQIVATDTSWRTDPPRFPVRWLIPALAVIAVTIVVGVLRYPDLPARLVAGWGGRRVPKSVLAAFAVVVGQLYVTVLWTGLMLLVYRSRPDIEAADPAGSTQRYRRFLAAFSRAVLTLMALVNLSVLLAALRPALRGRPARPGRDRLPGRPGWLPPGHPRSPYRRRRRRPQPGARDRPGRRPVLEGRADLRQPRRPGHHGRCPLRRRLHLQRRQPDGLASYRRHRCRARRPGRDRRRRGHVSRSGLVSAGSIPQFRRTRDLYVTAERNAVRMRGMRRVPPGDFQFGR
jgi:uncharacterized membrane protein